MCNKSQGFYGDQPAPVAPTPTDEEIGEWHDQCADLTRLGEVDHYWAFDLRSDEVAGVVRAALARWGRPTPQPPADGEVAELVEWLTALRDHDLRHVAPYSHPSIAHWHDFLTRAADLLERPTPQPPAELAEMVKRLHEINSPTPQPVPVSERWPEFSDCNPFEAVWAFNPVLDHWKLTRINQTLHTHWLPHWALPVPAPANNTINQNNY